MNLWSFGIHYLIVNKWSNIISCSGSNLFFYLYIFFFFFQVFHYRYAFQGYFYHIIGLFQWSALGSFHFILHDNHFLGKWAIPNISMYANVASPLFTSDDVLILPSTLFSGIHDMLAYNHFFFFFNFRKFPILCPVSNAL